MANALDRAEGGRYEKKYQVFGELAATRARFIDVTRALGYRLDGHVGDEGMYTLASLYFDTPEFYCLQSNADGDYFHVKFRIRTYAGGDRLFYEVKYKHGELIYKTRKELPMHTIHVELARREFRTLVLESGSRSLVRRDVLNAVDRLRPSCLVRYDRTPFVGAPAERLCLDGNLAFGPPVVDARLWFGPALAQVNAGLAILELKTHPDAVSRSLLSVGRIANHDISRFSKYCEAATWVHRDPTEYGKSPYVKLEEQPWLAAEPGLPARYKSLASLVPETAATTKSRTA